MSGEGGTESEGECGHGGKNWKGPRDFGTGGLELAFVNLSVDSDAVQKGGGTAHAAKVGGGGNVNDGNRLLSTGGAVGDLR